MTYNRREDIITEAVRGLELWAAARRDEGAISAGALGDNTGLYSFQVGYYAKEIVTSFNGRNRRLRVRYQDRHFHISLIEV